MFVVCSIYYYQYLCCALIILFMYFNKCFVIPSVWNSIMFLDPIVTPKCNHFFFQYIVSRFISRITYVLVLQYLHWYLNRKFCLLISEWLWHRPLMKKITEQNVLPESKTNIPVKGQVLQNWYQNPFGLPFMMPYMSMCFENSGQFTLLRTSEFERSSVISRSALNPITPEGTRKTLECTKHSLTMINISNRNWVSPT